MSSFRMRSTHAYVEAVVNPASVITQSEDRTSVSTQQQTGLFARTKDNNGGKTDLGKKLSSLGGMNSTKPGSVSVSSSDVSNNVSRTGNIGALSTPRVGSNSRGQFMHTTPSAQADYF